MKLKLLLLSNLFPSPWEPARAPYNREIFKRIAARTQMKFLVPIPVRALLKHPRSALKALFTGAPDYPFASFFLYIQFPGFMRNGNALSMFISLLLQRPWTIFFGRFDIMMGSWLFPDSLCLSKVARIQGSKLVSMGVGTDINNGLIDQSTRKGTLKVINNSESVIVVSQALRQLLLAEGCKPEKVHAVYTGVDRKLFYPGNRCAAKETLNLNPDGRMILFVGSLIATKGTFELIDAFHEFSLRDSHKTKLVLIGDGTAKEALVSRSISLGISDRVNFLGILPSETVGQWLRATDLFCLPSYREGVPNAILEAIATNVPVLATEVGGIPEVISESTGILVPAKDVDALVSAMLTFSANNWTLSELDKKKAFKISTWDKTAEQIMEVLIKAADKEI